VQAMKASMDLSISAACAELSTVTPFKDRIGGKQLRDRYNRANAYLSSNPRHRRTAEEWCDDLAARLRASGSPRAHAKALIGGWLVGVERRLRAGQPERRPLPRPRLR